MRRLMIAALALLLTPIMPASADWAPTRWGMTPEAVLAAVPGAVKMTGLDEDDEVLGMPQLVSAPYADKGIPMRAEFYFDKTSGTLSGVRFKLDDPNQCDDYDAILTQRYGQGERDVDTKVGSITSVYWDRGAGQDRLNFAHLQTSNGDHFLCLFMIRAPKGK